MGLKTYKRSLRTEIEIGTWGTACTGLLFLISAFVEFFTRGDVTWISEVGCVVGLATIAVILFRAHLSPRHLAVGRDGDTSNKVQETTPV